ncbi:MAG: hypothetical protein JNM36_06400, partial [Chitinophagales bacterium]|nr:hypothetical protein [Chitinophagales bacterium]
MKILFPFSIIIVLTFFCSSCIKKECRFAGFHEFELPVTLSPALDTFKIDDTISISSVFEDLVYERKMNEWFLLENIKFFPQTAVTRLDTLDVLDSFSEFDIIIPDQYDYYLFQYPSSGRKALIGEYNYENNTYSLKYQLVPKKKGLFYLIHGSDISVLGEGQEFEGQCCKKNIIDAYCKMNGGGDNNVDFLLQSPDSSYH